MTIVDLEPGMAASIQEARAKVVQMWQPYRSLQHFLKDYLPDEWDAIQTCGQNIVKEWEYAPDRDLKKVQLMHCNRIPWCIRCTRTDTHRRVANALQQFERCTPAGKQPRFIHIVQTAPTGTGEGMTGQWGHLAAQDHKKFGRIMWSALQELYGDGIGAIMSYQDFGEKGPLKIHPHQDLTLNGWRLKNGKAAPTPRFPLTDGGRKRWDDVVSAHATAFQVDASRGNVWIHNVVTGIPSYAKQFRYQMRQLVDLKKLHYNRSDRILQWENYRDGTFTNFTVDMFFDALTDYQRRLGAFTSRKMFGKEADDESDHNTQKRLHEAYGHMARTKIKATQKLMGGKATPHREDCSCNACGDWDRTFLAEVREEVGFARLQDGD